MIKMFTLKNNLIGKYFPQASNKKPAENKLYKSNSLVANNPWNTKVISVETTTIENNTIFESTSFQSNSNTPNAFFNKITCETFKLMKTYIQRYSRIAKLAASLVILFASTVFSQDIDIALKQSIDNAMPSVGDQIKYTVYLLNQGNTTATGITINSQTPFGAVNNVTTTASGGTATYNATNGLIGWSVASIAAGDSIKLEIIANATAEGVFFNVTEVMAADQIDIDSDPGNNKLNEDDIVSTCFSIPITWYPGDEYTVSIPASFKNGSGITWFKDNVKVDSNTVGATVNADSSLTIASSGSYTFETQVSTCPATGCCALVLLEGPYGSIGNYVWADANFNGRQDGTEDPIIGLMVYLLDSTDNVIDSTITNSLGIYKFDSLQTGKYKIQLIAPNSSVFTSKATGTNDTDDSDINIITGKSDLISINTAFPSGSKERDNNDVDAGIVPLGSIGDFVWRDTNENGQQNSGELGIDGIRVYLLSGTSTKLDSTFTGLNGEYLFDNLRAGTYKVQFIAPVLSEFTLLLTGNAATNSDAGLDGISDYVILNPKINDNSITTHNLTIDAGVIPQAFDLALAKTISSTSPFMQGDTVTYNILISNEGVLSATQIQITDKIPAGLTLADANWTLNGSNAVYNIPTTLATASSITVPITFKIDNNFSGTIINAAEITRAKGPSGEDVNDGDSVPNNNSTTEDDDDTESITVNPANNFDLALRKTVIGNTPFTAPGLVTYNLAVTNQGDITATFVNLVDYVPAGLTLLSNNWTMVGNLAKYDQEISLLPGATTNVQITFAIDANATGNLRNEAEISSAKGPNGIAVNDIDSTPDDIKGNDGTAIDNEITQNGKQGGDEDDHDYEVISIQPPQPIFDLALRKTVTTAGPFIPGSSVKYKIEVINQGEMDATFIKVVDIVPSNLILSDINWSQSGDTLMYIPELSLASGITTNIFVNFTVAPNAPVGVVRNNAEIASAKGPAGEDVTDIDSTPDKNPLNDGPQSDNVVNENGKLGGDEDDSDYAEVSIVAPIFDLALNKIVSTQGPYIPGQTVVYNLQVQNQGESTATNITITDNVPAGLTLVANNGWSMQSGKAVNNTPISVTVAQGSVTIPISFTVDNNFAGGKITNTAEIKDAKGPNGETVQDKDSTPNNGNAIEDDQDDAEITVDTPCPVILAANATNSEYCMGDSTNIMATSSNGGSISWFYSSVGGTPIFASQSGDNHLIFPTTTTTYYAQPTTVPANCPVSRTPVTVVVNARPSNPSCFNVVEICQGEFLNLNEHIINAITTPGGVFEWHVTASPSSALVTNPTAVGPGKYYLFEKSGKGCFSNPAVATVIEKPCDKFIDLSLIKVADNRNVNLNDVITYTISVSNAGPDVATNVIIEDILPAGLTFVSSSDFTLTAGTLKGTIASMNVNQTKVLTYKAKATGIGNIINIAQVSAADQSDLDSTPGNSSTKNEDDDDDEIITVYAPNLVADLSLQKLVSNSTPAVGDLITYTIIVTNDGPDAATNVTVKDVIPAGLTYVSASGGTSNTFAANTVTAKFNSIASGATAQFTISATVTATSGTVNNKAEITESDQSDPDSTPATGTNEDDDDTVVITILKACNPPTPIVSTNANSICLGQSATLTSVGCTGIVEWSNAQTGASIEVSPTSNKSYTAHCKVGECVSTESNIVSIVVSNPATPSITANNNTVCSGEVVTLTSTSCSGTVNWSNGMTGLTINATPLVTTSYSATCSVGAYTSNTSNIVTVTVGSGQSNPTITATANTVCAGSPVTLTAVNCSGNILWSNSFTTASITVTPTATTTYSVTCGSGTCKGTAVKTITIGTAQAPVITATKQTVCAGESTVLTASNCSSGLTWSTGSTASTITVSPTSTTTYSVICGTGTCSGTGSISISVGTGQLPVIAASKQSICAGESTVLTASNCSSGLTWSTGSTASSITVSPTVTTTYSATCGTGTCAGTGSISISVSTASSLTITASKAQICLGDSTTLTASACTQGLTWSTGSTASSITVKPTATQTYTATCGTGTCAGTGSQEITVGTGSSVTITANNNSVCSGETVELTATGCASTLTWSTGQTGNKINVTPTQTTLYTASCGTSVCAGTGSININVGTPQTPVITASAESICGSGSVTLTLSNCSSSITWSTGAISNAITVSPTTTTTYTVLCGTANCSGSASKTISVGSSQTPSITASNTESLCAGQSTTLSAIGCTNGLSWNTGQTSPTIIVSPTATTTYTATCTGNCGGAGTIVVSVINSSSAPTISASTNSVCEAGPVTLTAAGCNGTVKWSNAMTGNSITVDIAANATFTATCSNGICTSGNSNTLNITFGNLQIPSISASGSKVCAGSSVNLTAQNCGGTVKWSNGQTGASITVSPVVQTTYTATCSIGNCISGNSNSVMVEIITAPNAPVISCSAARICAGESLTLNGLGCEGTVKWSTGQTGASITISPTETTVYTATCLIGSCESQLSAPTTINVGKPFPPQVSCQSTLICLGASASIKAEGCVGTVEWSTGQIGSVITVTPTAMTSYSAICKGETCQSEKSNVVTIGVSGTSIVAPTVTSLTNVCPAKTVSLNNAVTSTPKTTGGSFIFTTGNSPNSPVVTNPTSIATSGTFYVFENGGNGCYSAGTKIDVGIISCEQNVDCIINPATATAGANTTVCLKDDFYQLSGAIGGAAKIGTWSTNGTGTFSNATALNAKYNYSVEDVNKGNVTLTLTTDDPDGAESCTAAVSSITLTINAVKTKPTITSSKSPVICLGDSVILTANETAAKYLWSTGDTTKSIVVKTLGDYTVKLTNAGGCSSLSSNALVVTNMAGIASPSVNDLAKNTCPSTSVNLSNQVLSTPVSNGGVFEFHTGISPSSAMISNVSSMPTGNYYVFEKSTLGCYSNPSLIKVIIDNCKVDTSDAEVAILKTGSKTSVSLGDEITYTIKVTNNGASTATNVAIEDLVPVGLELVGPTPGLTLSGNKLIATIASLAVNESKTFIYKAKIVKSGTISNVAKIVALDQTDPIKSNNVSQWDVECSTCQAICIATSLNAKKELQANGSYNIKFTSLVSNCGNVELTGLDIAADMATMFGNTATYTMIQQPTVNAGSALVPNVAYNGGTETSVLTKSTSVLSVADKDTVTWVINLVPNGTQGSFSMNAIASGIGMSIFNTPSEVSDVSNDGLIIIAASGTPTVVKLYQAPGIGLSLAIIDTVRQSNGSLNVIYQAIVKNNGELALNNVIVSDTLSKTYVSPVTFTVLGTPTTTGGLVPNPNYNGSTDVNLTLPSSTMAVNKKDTILFIVNVLPNNQKTFVNQAIAHGTGTLIGGGTETVVDLSNTGYNPDLPGSEPTMLDLNIDDTQSVQTPCIGVALYVSDTAKLADGSFDITYTTIIRNCGNVNLTNVAMCDTLGSDFNAPSVVTLKKAPSLGLNSTLSLNTNYDGVANTCMLNEASSSIAPNKSDTINWTINLTLNSNNGPFRKNVEVTAKTASDKQVSDISNDGKNPAPEGEEPTVLNFNNLPPDLIGIAKELISIEPVGTNLYDVVFKFNVKNYGIVDFTGVQVQDNLAQTFGNDVIIDSVSIFDVSPGFALNTGFTGKGLLIDLLDETASTLPVKTTRSLSLLTRIDLTNADTTRFENMALAIGYQNGTSTDDLSNIGKNPDPEADGTPANNSIPTLIDFGTIVEPPVVTPIGIAKAVSDTVAIVDGSYQMTYSVIVKNYSDTILTNIQLVDSLSTVFGDSTDFILVGTPTKSASSTLTLNPEFDGVTDYRFLVSESSTLAAGASDTITFKVKVRNNSSSNVTYNNTIYASAISKSKSFTDKSNSGQNPDSDGDNNPGNNNTPTSITLKSGQNSNPTNVAVSIPGGISPNGDGINDVLVIEGISSADEVSMKIYNRWGELVFITDNYKLLYPGVKDGWAGISNSGIRFSNSDTKLPDGTYFYSVESKNKELFNGKPIYNFLTIAGGTKR
jgi:uncharacterized repeat protein (TIGR01451 family)/gliding motility-associated-like protein